MPGATLAALSPAMLLNQSVAGGKTWKRSKPRKAPTHFISKGYIRIKRRPSRHQKQIRFFTGAFMAAIAVATILIFWFMNRD